MLRGIRRDARGFTLLELMFAISVMVTAMVIVGPPTARVFDGQALRAARNEVLAAHTLARSLAIQYGRPTQLEIDSGKLGQLKNPFFGSLTVRADTTLNGGGTKKVRTVKIIKGFMTSNRARLCFDARGFPVTSLTCEAPDATVILRVSSGADTLRFSQIGELLP